MAILTVRTIMKTKEIEQKGEALPDADNRMPLLATGIEPHDPDHDEQRIKDDAAFRQLIARL